MNSSTGIRSSSRYLANAALVFAILSVACGGAGDSGGDAIVLSALTRVWPEAVATGEPVAELVFGDRLHKRGPPVADPEDSTRKFLPVQTDTGERGWVLAADVMVNGVPAVVTGDTRLREVADRLARPGEVLSRLTPVAVLQSEDYWSLVATATGQLGWVPDGRLTFRAEDIGVAASIAAAAAGPERREERLAQALRAPGFSSSIFAADGHARLWEARDAALLSASDSDATPDPLGLLPWIGTELGLREPERFSTVARRSPGLDPEDLRALEAEWTKGCEGTCMLTMADEVAQVLADSALIPFLIEAAPSAGSPESSPAWTALRILGPDLEDAALRSVMELAEPGRAIEAMRTLHARGDSSAVRAVQRVLNDPDRLERLDAAGSLQALVDVARELGIHRGMERFTLLDRSGALDRLTPSEVDALVWKTTRSPTTPTREDVNAIITALERRPRLWTVLMDKVGGIPPLMNDPEFRSRVSDVALRLLQADADEVRRYAPNRDIFAWHSSGVFFADRYPSRPLVEAVIGTLIDLPQVDWYQATQTFLRRQRFLVRVTGVGSAPRLKAPTPENRDRVMEFWSAWWDEHGRDFTPVSLSRGMQAVQEWQP